MWCYFMRGDHIAAFEELTGLSDEAATTKADALLSERKYLFEGFELWDRTRVVIRHPGYDCRGAALIAKGRLARHGI